MPVMHKKKLPPGPDGAEILRAEFRAWLNEEEYTFWSHVHGNNPDPWRYVPVPQTLRAVWKDCEREVHPKGILYNKGADDEEKDRYELFEPVREALDYETSSPVWKALVTMRMMQLNLAGDDKWAEHWATSLMYDKERLFKLVFTSKDGTTGWDHTIAQNKFEEFCPACGIDGRKIWKQDRMRVVPCSHNHLVHAGDVEECFKTRKTCPQCWEVVL